MTLLGDSGGPSFVEEGSNFILTGNFQRFCYSALEYNSIGVVSGGRGELGNCGGVNNPVHYVR